MAIQISRGIVASANSQILARLEQMTPAERLSASRTVLDPHERSVWAARYPDEVPLVNGEFEWIALLSADHD